VFASSSWANQPRHRRGGNSLCWVGQERLYMHVTLPNTPGRLSPLRYPTQVSYSSWPNGHGVWLRFKISTSETRRFQVRLLAGKKFRDLLFFRSRRYLGCFDQLAAPYMPISYRRGESFQKRKKFHLIAEQLIDTTALLLLVIRTEHI
jgi:hypothetical protein